MMIAILHGRSVPASVSRSFDGPDSTNAYASLISFVLLAARDADRPLVINPPCCQELSSDEVNIAAALSALTRDSSCALGCLRALIGGEPSAALCRQAALIADHFAAVGLGMGLGDTQFAA